LPAEGVIEKWFLAVTSNELVFMLMMKAMDDIGSTKTVSPFASKFFLSYRRYKGWAILIHSI
jgi:hypothetical protein